MYSNNNNAYCENVCFEHHSLPLALWTSVVCTIRIWRATKRLRADVVLERRELADLPDYILRDIGIDRADASAESNRHKNDLPQDRLRRLQQQY